MIFKRSLFLVGLNHLASACQNVHLLVNQLRQQVCTPETTNIWEIQLGNHHVGVSKEEKGQQSLKCKCLGRSLQRRFNEDSRCGGMLKTTPFDLANASS